MVPETRFQKTRCRPGPRVQCPVQPDPENLYGNSGRHDPAWPQQHCGPHWKPWAYETSGL